MYRYRHPAKTKICPMNDNKLPENSKCDAPVAGPSLIDELIDAAATGTTQERLRIIQRITDLFVAGSQSFSSQQIAVFDDVLEWLATDIETKARATLSHKIAAIANAPPRLIRSLAFDDEIAVAGPVLVFSQQLSDADLVENATNKSQKHLMAIAQRLKLNEAVTDVLVKRGDREVVQKVVKNKGATFSLAGYGWLTNRARHDRMLTLTLGQRSDIPRQYFLKLLETASASVRQKLEAANPNAAAAIREVIDDVATDMQQEARMASHEFATAVRDAKRRHNEHPVTEANVHATAHSQEFERTAIALAQFGGFSLDLVERALLAEGEEMILIFAKAAGCSWVTFKELLLMYHANRKIQPDDLTRLFEKYKKLGQETARKVITFHVRRNELRAQKASQAGTAPAKNAHPAGVGNKTPARRSVISSDSRKFAVVSA